MLLTCLLTCIWNFVSNSLYNTDKQTNKQHRYLVHDPHWYRHKAVDHYMIYLDNHFRIPQTLSLAHSTTNFILQQVIFIETRVFGLRCRVKKNTICWRKTISSKEFVFFQFFLLTLRFDPETRTFFEYTFKHHVKKNTLSSRFEECVAEERLA